MTRRTQRLIATCLVASGGITGLWVGVSFIRAQAQSGGIDGNIPTDGVPAPPNPAAPPPAEQPPAAPPTKPPSPPAQPPQAPPQAPPAAAEQPPAAQQPLPPPPPMDGNVPAEDLQGGPQDVPADGAGFRAATDGFIYNPEGLRDPFFPSRGLQIAPPTPIVPTGPVAAPEPDFDVNDPLQKYELREYRLVAVLWDVRHPKAMVATPDGKVWTIRQKVRLGRAGAVVAAIRESEIVVVEPNPDGSYVNASTRVISIKQ